MQRTAIIALFAAALLAVGCGEEKEITFYGDEFTIIKPKSWSMQTDLNDEADLQMGNIFREAYLIVLTEPKEDFPDGTTLDEYGDLTRNLMLATTTGLRETNEETLEIGGKEAVRYTFTGTIEGLQAKYWHICVDTGDHFHQVIIWSLANRFDENRADFNRALMSLRVTSEIPGGGEAAE